ncbi:HlyD family secretion protein [Fulvivirga sediminis]|uniref:HlyD family secretion protein n=1 Tax=Fulvivirga sediminis TaxID=2803949 RepID=A0A937K2I4_9BACT|nr:HlyD family secretion protein [Fulvivirga sediminis]MBL3657852.1 HlyD family secretion protein [Fulvivirga sediminis]
MEKPEQNNKKGNKLFPIIFAGIVLVGLVYGAFKYIHSLHYEETEDAQLEADISPIIPKVSGYIEKVYIDDNQEVKKGDTLVILESKDYQIKVVQAEAAYENALANLEVVKSGATSSNANVSTSQANIATVQANIEAAKVDLWRATQDYNRYENLIKDHSITQQQFDQVRAAKESAEKRLEVLERQKSVASRQKYANQTASDVSVNNIGVAEANVKMSKAQLDLAKLQLSYTILTAPINGVISQRHVEVGQFVQAGQSLFAIVEDDDIWVVANLKETQMEKIRPGQEVEISVDAVPGIKFKGKVESIAGATGAKFSLLPPDNATGNFVKVVQRIPVKIELEEGQENIDRLRAGMNVIAEIALD